MTSILNHHHASRDKQPFSLINLKFAEDPSYYCARRSCRILLYKEMLGSFFLRRTDEEFRDLVGLFCQAFDISIELPHSATYQDCIESIADHLPEAHALRWSSDCGGHYDKLTCNHFPLTLAYSFRHRLSNIKNKWLRDFLGETSHGLKVIADYTTNEITSSRRPEDPHMYHDCVHAEITSPRRPEDLHVYHDCMYAAYSRICLHNHAVLCSLRSRLLGSSDFCLIARLVYFILKETQATLVDYYHVYENEKSLMEMCSTTNHNDQVTTTMKRATLSSGKCYKSPQTLTRMVCKHIMFAFIFVHYYFCKELANTIWI